MNFLGLIKEILRGKDLYRILMNGESPGVELRGKILDVGSGQETASYHRFFKKDPSIEVIPLDLAADGKMGKKIDLEKEELPFPADSVDAALAFNVLEHLYNYGKLLEESRRVLKPEGRFIGAVPFLVGYHPDPRDFWRFTGESLEKILAAAGFKNITIRYFGYGPWLAGFSQVEFMFPRVLKIILLPMLFLLDWLLLMIKPKFDRRKFALGLFFIATK